MSLQIPLIALHLFGGIAGYFMCKAANYTEVRRLSSVSPLHPGGGKHAMALAASVLGAVDMRDHSGHNLDHCV